MPRIPDRLADLEVTVYGQAASKGSSVSFPARRGDGSIVMMTTKTGKKIPKMIHKGDDNRAGAWAGSIAQTVGERMLADGFEPVPMGVPVIIEMIFYRPRNQSDFGTGRNAGVLKDSAPAYPSVRPDVDKQVRLVLDALKTVAWHDDSQVVGAPAGKDYGAPGRLELRIWRLPATVADLASSEVDGASPQNALFVAGETV